MAADKRSEVDNVTKVRSSVSTDISDNEDDESYNHDDLAAIADLLRAKHQADITLSRAENEVRKANVYLQRKKDNLASIHETYIGEEKDPLQRDFKTFTYDDCLALKVAVAEEPDNETGEKNQISIALEEKVQIIDLQEGKRVKLT